MFSFTTAGTSGVSSRCGRCFFRKNSFFRKNNRDVRPLGEEDFGRLRARPPAREAGHLRTPRHPEEDHVADTIEVRLECQKLGVRRVFEGLTQFLCEHGDLAGWMGGSLQGPLGEEGKIVSFLGVDEIGADESEIRPTRHPLEHCIATYPLRNNSNLQVQNRLQPSD